LHPPKSNAIYQEKSPALGRYLRPKIKKNTKHADFVWISFNSFKPNKILAVCHCTHAKWHWHLVKFVLLVLCLEIINFNYI